MPSRLRLFYWKVEGATRPIDDETNYPIFQSYSNINPETKNGCGSAAINCLTQSSHGKKMARAVGPMLYNRISPTGGAVGVATTVSRVTLGVLTLGISEAVISPTLCSIFSESKSILKAISAYDVTPGNKMSFLRETVVDSKNPVLLLFDRGPDKFHWVCCCGYLEREDGTIVYVCNDWGRIRLISSGTIDGWTSATLDNFVAVKSNKWCIGYADLEDGKLMYCDRDFAEIDIE